MNIQEVFRDCYVSVKNCCYRADQFTMSAILKAKALRNNPDFFQKTCQIAFSSLQLLFNYHPERKNSLARLSIVLLTANMHDFFRFIQQPRQWFYPVNVEAINEDAVLEDLTLYLYHHRFGSEPIHQHTQQYLELMEIVKNCLSDQLNQMIANDDSYRNLNEFIQVLQKRLRTKDYDFSGINLNDLQAPNSVYDISKWVKHVPLLKRIENINWSIVDLGCAGLFLQEWHLLDTAKWANRIGQYSALQWVKEQRLDNWVTGLVCTGFFWKFLESVRKLNDEVLTMQEKREAHWSAVTSLADLIFFGAIYLNLSGKTRFNNVYMQCFAIVARSLGLLSIITRPKHQFFQQVEFLPVR